jgi:DNA processing protein
MSQGQENLCDWLALSFVTGVGSRTASRLIERWGSPTAVFAASRAELQAFGLSDELIDRLQAPEPRRLAEHELARLDAMGATILTLADAAYPPLLREIYDPPIVLYARGDLEGALRQPCLAVVGTRRPSTYGSNVAVQLARDLAARGLTIVSGFARGIDSAAHRGALEAQGKTLAVFGTGLDVVYPRENTRLAEAICAHGAVVTEFPLGTAPTPQNFPFRNRIISGLSLGVVVVEAAQKSGSLITARLALEQDRDVFAVPGNITSATSFGPNYLIKSGAKLVQYWRDVVEELPFEIGRRILQQELTAADAAARPLTLPLDEREEKVLGLLSFDVPTHIDDLLVASGLPSPVLMQVLLELEVKDKITQLPGKNFVKKM